MYSRVHPSSSVSTPPAPFLNALAGAVPWAAPFQDRTLASSPAVLGQA